jgi:hypothetical protein
LIVVFPGLAHIVSLVGSDPGLLCLLPALALVLPLIARRCPGEALLARLSPRRRSRWPRPRASVPAPRRAWARTARGGLLLGRALAVRPPPAVGCQAS